MMKKTAKLLAFYCSFIAFSAIAAEENPYYVEFGFGRSNGYVPYTGELPSGHYGGASVSSIALGKKFNEHIAFDVDLSYRGEFTNNDDKIDTVNGLQDGDVSINSLTAMLNGYYYYYNKFPDFRPYITAGAGISRNKSSNLVVSGVNEDNEPNSTVTSGETTTSFTWKLGAGLKYKLDEKFELDLRYQFINLGDVKMSDSSSHYSNGNYVANYNVTNKSSRLSSHEILVGIAYKF